MIILTGCSSNTPEKVAEKFLTAYLNGNIEEAKLYGSKNTQEGLNFVAKMLESDKTRENMLPTNVKVKAVNCELSEDKTKAVVYLELSYLDKKEGQKSETTKIDLIKEEEEWKVVFKVK